MRYLCALISILILCSSCNLGAKPKKCEMEMALSIYEYDFGSLYNEIINVVGSEVGASDDLFLDINSNGDIKSFGFHIISGDEHKLSESEKFRYSFVHVYPKQDYFNISYGVYTDSIGSNVSLNEVTNLLDNIDYKRIVESKSTDFDIISLSLEYFLSPDNIVSTGVDTNIEISTVSEHGHEITMEKKYKVKQQAIVLFCIPMLKQEDNSFSGKPSEYIVYEF